MLACCRTVVCGAAHPAATLGCRWAHVGAAAGQAQQSKTSEPPRKTHQVQRMSSVIPISPKATASTFSHTQRNDSPGWLLAPGRGCHEGTSGAGQGSSTGRCLGKGIGLPGTVDTLACGV